MKTRSLLWNLLSARWVGWKWAGASWRHRCVGICVALAFSSTVRAEESAAAIEARLSGHVRYLASDELEGRGIGTKGLDLAAEHIAKEFRSLHLATDLFAGEPYQKFTVTAKVEPGPAEKNRLAFQFAGGKEGMAPSRIELQAGVHFASLAIGESGVLDLPLVFVGYGITASDSRANSHGQADAGKSGDRHKEEKKAKDRGEAGAKPAEGGIRYDDYAGLDVKGKAVIILRKEPQQEDPHSVFDGTSASFHAHFSTKMANAVEHGAAAVILVNDGLELSRKREENEKAWTKAVDELAAAQAHFKEEKEATEAKVAAFRKRATELAETIASLGKKLEAGVDGLLKFEEAGRDSRGIPVFFCTRASIDTVVKQALGRDLATIERAIDENLKPQSAELLLWRMVGEQNINRRQAEVKNVIAELPGEGPLAEETIVVGAHYDHLGLGDEGTLAPWTREIHNGADDNASGTAALLEIAREYATRSKKPARRLVFMAFTGEERGLLGSAKYTREPRFPLEKTIAMVNLDMVGRMRDDKMIVYGTGTAAEFDGLVTRLNEQHKFTLVKKPEGFGPSDQSSFYAKQIPVLHLFTDTHSDYHRPSDDVEKLNLAGMRRAAAFVVAIVDALAAEPKPPSYRAAELPQASRGGSRPYFGSIPDFGQEAGGFAISGVSPGSPADKGGLKGGDIIKRLGDVAIANLDDFDRALRKFKAGDEVEVAVKRGQEELKLKVTLAPPR